MMAYTRPVINTEISAGDFGQPIFDRVQSYSSLRFVLLPATTCPASVATAIFNQVITVPAHVAGLLAIVTVGYTSTGAGDLLATGNSIIGFMPAASGAGGMSGSFYYPASGGTVAVQVRVSAWGGQPITVDGNKSKLSLLPIGSTFTGNTVP